MKKTGSDGLIVVGCIAGRVDGLIRGYQRYVAQSAKKIASFNQDVPYLFPGNRVETVPRRPIHRSHLLALKAAGR
jgi:hypothetical protein